ncbi:MAG: hypothetical protein GVY08_06045 [Bacteroidetes bacterium]|jgi:hypothetical protein|nr:hypothetical protein [Bacteroidota bacterium]
MYKKLNRSALFTAVVLLLISGCDTSLDGNLNENLPPTTNLTVDNIEVDDENRLSSRVDISWWGDDPDGFITGYEFAIADTSEGNWSFTTQTDSTFILPISPGQETDDVLFAVRSIDNEGAIDPGGASVRFPLRNSAPTTEMNTLELPPDTTYGLFSFGWSISDPDGRPTILRTEIAVNDTTNGWTEIPIESEDQENFFISLVLQDQSQETASADLYLGRSFRNSDLVIDNFRVNDDNTLYVRTLDRARSVSEVQEHEWFLKRQTSNILLLNDDASSSSQSNLSFHEQQLSRLGFSVDIIDISDGSGLSGGNVPLSSAFPRVINPTLNRTLAQWDHIYHFSNSLNRNINFAQEILVRFFDQGGTMYSSIPIFRDETREDNPLLNFLSISEFVPIDPENAERGFQIRDDFEIRPMDGGPLLTFTGGINSAIWPFFPVGGAAELYEAELLKRFAGGGLSRYEGPSTISVLNPERNFLYFGMDMTNITVSDANEPDDLSGLLEELLINRLGFTQQ